MFALSVMISDILTVELYITLTLTFERAKAKCKYANGKAVCDLIFVGSSNVCPVCHHLREIRNRNVHDLNLDLYNK